MQALRPLLPILTTFLVLIGALWFGFDRYLTSEQAGAVSGSLAETPGQAIIARARDGHFRGTAEINGQPVDFMVDSGASQVALDDRDAERLGLSRGQSVPVRTVNGRATGYVTELDRLRVGGIEVRHVRALVVPSLDGPMLLGNTFLHHFDSRTTGDAMTLTTAQATR